MKTLLFVLLFLAAVAPSYAGDTLKDVYGSLSGCTIAQDIDEGDPDRIGPLDYKPNGKVYSVTCYDTSDWSGLRCRVLQGDSTVDASSGEGSDGEGEILQANEKTMITVTGPDNAYLSFEPFADGTTQVGVACRRN